MCLFQLFLCVLSERQVTFFAYKHVFSYCREGELEKTENSPLTIDIALSMGFSRQEYWSRLPFPSPGDLPGPGIEPRSPALQADALPSEPPGKPIDIATPIFFYSALNLILWSLW